MNPEKNKIYLGDCLEIMKDWDDDSIDHCITDPPYNMSKPAGLGWAFSSHVTMQEDWDQFTREDYLEFSKCWIEEVSRVVKPNGNIYIFGTYHNIYDIGFIVQDLDLRIINSIIWFKPNAQPNITCRMLTESTEQAIWVCNESSKKAKGWVFNYEDAKALNDGKQMRNMWSMPYTSMKEKEFGKHPSQKPINLILRMILIGSQSDDIILDCFAGSGTTGVVAQGVGRNWVMIERDESYYKIAKDRLENVKIEYPQELLQIRLDLKLDD